MTYKITSQFGYTFKRLSYFPLRLLIVFIISNLVNFNLYGIIFLIFFLLAYYLTITKKVLRAKDVTFDKHKMYFDEEEIPVENIIAIEKDKILYLENGIEMYVYYNNFLPDNLDFFKDIISINTSHKKKDSN